MNTSGFTGAFNLLISGLAATVTFVCFPAAFDLSWPWLNAHVIGRYGPTMQEGSSWIWSLLLVWVLFALTRAGLMLILALGGLVITLLLIFRNWWR